MIRRRSRGALASAFLLFAVFPSLACRGAPGSRVEVEERLARGQELERQGVLESALEEYRLGAEAARALPGAPLLRARLLNRLGALHLRRGESDRARASIEEALEAGREAGDEAETSEALFQLGSLHYSFGRMRDASRLFEASAGSALAAGDRVRESRAQLYLGLAATAMEDLDRAEGTLEKAAQLARTAADARAEAEAIRALGQVHSQRGENQKALEHLERARSLLSSSADAATEAVILNGMGQVYFDMGETEIALSYYLQALERNRALGIRRREAGTMLEVGRAELDLGRVDDALRRFEEALAMYRELKNPRLEADVLAELGRLHVRKGDDGEALRYFERAIELKRMLSDSGGRAYILDEAGEAHRRLGRIDDALRMFGEAAALSREASDPLFEAQALYHRAKAHRDSGELDLARSTVEESLRLAETLRAKVASHGLRTAFFQSIHERHSFYVDLLLKLHRERPRDGFSALAFQAAERGRARTLQESLQEAAAGIREGIDPPLLDEERSLRRKLNELAIEQRLLSPEEAVPLQHEIDALFLEYDRLQSTIRSRSPRYAALTEPKAATLAEAQSFLDGETRLLAYHLGAERSFLWSVDRSGHSVHELPRGEEVESIAREAYRILKSPASPGRALPPDSPLHRLSKILLEPAGAFEETRILVIADGALSYVPFAALLDPWASDEPLVASREIARLPSASIAPILRAQRSGKSYERWLAIAADAVYGGDYPRLAETLREARAIESLAPPGKVEVVTGVDASREWFDRTDFGRFRAIHLAAHGVLDDRRPELSGIVLSLRDDQGAPTDGFVRLHDVYNARLPVELVVLSACETGLGREIRGEGLVGLVRGFFYAGASAVIASSWKVDDRATAELMTAFYRRLFQGEAPAKALRQAQLSLYGSRRFRDPYYWAAFELQGDGR